MAAAALKAKLDKLAEKFNVEDHKKNPKGFTYIAIEKVLKRFQTVTPDYGMEIKQATVTPLPGVTWSRAGKPAGMAVVVVAITVDGITREGVGGSFQALENVDDMVKTALAEAIKKAGNQFGLGLYLWEEEERALIDAAQAAGMTGQVVAAGTAPQVAAPPIAPPVVPQNNGTEGTVVPLTPAVPDVNVDELKAQVAAIAQAAGVQITGPALAAHFNVPVESLQDPSVLLAIINAQPAAS